MISRALATAFLLPVKVQSWRGRWFDFFPVRKLAVACRWLAVHNLDQLYVLVSSAIQTTLHYITKKVLDVT